MTYNALGQLVTLQYADGASDTRVWDAAGRLSSVTRAGNAYSFTRDGLDNVTREQGPAGGVDSTYDIVGRRRTLSVDGQTTINFGYDNADRLVTISQAAGSSNGNVVQNVTYSWDTANRLFGRTLPNQIAETRTLNQSGDVTQMSFSSSASSLGVITYSYDPLHHPPTRPMSDAETTLGNDGKLGFRVPCVLLGPRVPAATVTRFPFDPSSIHQLIQWRFGIDPVGVRGNAPGTFNLAYALDFASPARTDAPAIPVAPGPFGSACPIPAPTAPASGASGAAAAATMAAEISNEIPRFTDVRELADTFGFPRL